MKISIVSTLYNSSNYIEEFYNRIVREVLKITSDYEIILIDDGSPDDSLKKSIDLVEMDSRVRVFQLSRNFGHHKAIMAGLSYALGDYVFLIDSDLEEEPELLSLFWEKINKNHDVDVCYGVQKKRKGNFIEKKIGGFTWKIISKLSHLKIPRDTVTARLMKREYIDALKRYNESEIFIAGIWADCGFSQHPLYIEKKSTSATTYTLSKKISLFVNGITSFTNKPLILAFNIGFFITFLSLLLIFSLSIRKIFYSIPVDGWTSLVVAISFFSGLIIVFLGVIGIYIAKIFIEVKGRPNFIVKREYIKNDKFDKNEMLKSTSDYFSEKIKVFKNTPQGVDWNSDESQNLRFKQVAKVIKESEGFTINDFGCGSGAFSQFLINNDYRNFTYHGSDISLDMIDSAKDNYKNDFVSFKHIKDIDDMNVADYTVASGVFNMKRNISDSDWERYVKESIICIAEKSSKGFSFNLLTSYSDLDKMREDLYYANPLDFFDFCKKNFSKNVSLLHDYDLYDFTIVVRK